LRRPRQQNARLDNRLAPFIASYVLVLAVLSRIVAGRSHLLAHLLEAATTHVRKVYLLLSISTCERVAARRRSTVSTGAGSPALNTAGR
jgi:hypothetical protein